MGKRKRITIWIIIVLLITMGYTTNEIKSRIEDTTYFLFSGNNCEWDYNEGIEGKLTKYVLTVHFQFSNCDNILGIKYAREPTKTYVNGTERIEDGSIPMLEFIKINNISSIDFQAEFERYDYFWTRLLK